MPQVAVFETWDQFYFGSDPKRITFPSRPGCHSNPSTPSVNLSLGLVEITQGGLKPFMRTILLIILILLLIGALPTWPYSTGWGYYPSGGLGLILLIVIVFALLGYF